MLHPENETRLLSLPVTDIRAQTRTVLRAMAAEATEAIGLIPWLALQQWLAHQRKELERLCRYVTRPVIANERLSRNGKGQVVLANREARIATARPTFGVVGTAATSLTGAARGTISGGLMLDRGLILARGDGPARRALARVGGLGGNRPLRSARFQGKPRGVSEFSHG